MQIVADTRQGRNTNSVLYHKVMYFCDTCSQSAQDNFQELHRNIKEGDIVGVEGFPSQFLYVVIVLIIESIPAEKNEKGELHVVVQKIKPCSHPSQHPHFSLTDKETSYLELNASASVPKNFTARPKMIEFLRKFFK